MEDRNDPMLTCSGAACRRGNDGVLGMIILLRCVACCADPSCAGKETLWPFVCAGARAIRSYDSRSYHSRG